ncbi:hypothetical protein C8R44DRAFT_792059 [Mycena epipterygia]|nr:hypothetical protein C8R44DRAFT_792059 [Mycena epipterygia]
MASSSTAPRVVLPSIHEMFPEHLMPHTSSRPRAAPIPAFSRTHFVPVPPPPPSFSFDVLKSDPRGASLQHIASSRPTPRVRIQHSSSGSSDGDDAEMDDVEGEEDGGGPEEGKKHVCPTCAKRFNRPSSLRIHVNTHTGATREFQNPVLSSCSQFPFLPFTPCNPPPIFSRQSHIISPIICSLRQHNQR